MEATMTHTSDAPFFVKFERTQGNLALLQFLLSMPEQKFEVYGIDQNKDNNNNILSDYQIIMQQMENYNPLYDEDYINSIIKSATPEWSKIKDKDKWLHELRAFRLTFCTPLQQASL